MSESINSFNILALFGYGASRDILQLGVQTPDIKLDFFSGELPGSFSDALAFQNYDLILLDKKVQPGFEKILEIISAELKYIPVVLLGQEKSSEFEIFSKDIWDYCEIKDAVKLKRLVNNFKKLKFAKTKESGISEFLKIRDQYTDIITKNAKEGIIITQDGKFRYADPQIVNFLGRSKEELYSTPFIEFVHPEDKDLVMSNYKKRLSGIEIIEKYIFRVLSPDGEYVSIENLGFMVMWEGKPATLYLVTEVTERLIYETDLKNSDRKFRELLEKMIEATVSVDLNGVILNFNNAFHRLSLSSKEELIGKNLNDFIPDEWRKEDEKHKNQAMNRGYCDSFELNIKRENHLQIPVEGLYYLREDENGKPEGYWCFFRDIQKRKQFENDLEESEIQLKTVLEYFPAPIILIDLSFIRDYLSTLDKRGEADPTSFFKSHPDEFVRCLGNIQINYTNKEALQFFEVGSMKELENYLINTKDKDRMDLLLGVIRTFWKGESDYEEEVIFQIRPQTKKNAIFKSVILPGKEGTWDTILISLNDLSERIVIDKQIRVLSGAIEHSPVSVIITDTKGKIEYVNPKFSETSGYTYEEVLGKYTSILKSGNSPKELYKALWDTISSGKQWTGEIQNKTKNGKLYWESASISGVKNDKGEITHYVAIKEDITDRKNTISELREAKNKAEESDRLKTAFLANMSHEIRTPMNAIVGFSELLRTTDIQGPEREEYFNIINNSCNTLSNLIDDIIDLAKIEAGQTTIAEDLCKPYELMRELHRYFEEEIRKLGKPIRLVMDAAIDPDQIIKSDEFRLRQILSNIIGNAVKFTEKGIIAWGCTVEKESYIKFFVKDTGIGISPENIKLVFDRFRQMDDSSIRKYGGTGLGLPVSKSLVDLMGGEIWVESQIAKGSEFYFKIPYKPVNEEAFKENEVQLKTDLEYSFKNKGVLIVEDNLSNFEFIKAVLSRTKAKLFWADTGIKAVEIFKKKRKHIHLVLMDIQIPEMDGYEATRLMKKIRSDIPIIAQTAFAMSRDKEKSLDAGCDDYISKPIKPSDLLNMLAKYL